MKAILNIHKLKNLLPLEDIARLEANALDIKRISNISFKVEAANELKIYIQTTQGKNLKNRNITDDETLVELTKDLVQPFFPTKIIIVQASPFLKPVVDVVTPEWITDSMYKYKIKIKDLTGDTGIDKSNFSAWINGIRPMSHIVKAMIFNIIKIYALRDFANWLSKDNLSAFSIKKYFDEELIKMLLYNNKNVDKYNVKFTEQGSDYIITLSLVED
jgi:hypothetical protein